LITGFNQESGVRILALETSERIGSVALLEEGKLLREVRLDPLVRTASSLAPAIASLLAEVTWQPRMLELVAVNLGPGSFTGLRQGVTMAKTLAYSLGIPVLGINTLESIGWDAPPEVTELAVISDAQRQQVFAGKLGRDQAGILRLRGEVQIQDNQQWLENLSPGTVVSGPALLRLGKLLPNGVTPLAETQWAPRASAVGSLAYLDFQAGKRQEVFALLPLYYRLSAAEELRLTKETK